MEKETHHNGEVATRYIFNKPKKYKNVIVIGRFKPVQNAHLELFDQAFLLGENVIISCGSAHRPVTIKNHITSEESARLILKALKSRYGEESGWSDYPKQLEDNLKFIHVRDYLYNNVKWSQEIYSKAQLVGATSDKDTAILGCFKDDSSWYLNMFPQWSLETIQPVKDPSGELISSTRIRDNIFQGKYPSDNEALLPEALNEDVFEFTKTDACTQLKDDYHQLKAYTKKWGTGPFLTVDAVVIKSGHVLLIERKRFPGKGLWALAGGFLDPHENILDGAIRELKEETKIKVDRPVLKRSVEEMRVFDHPNRSLRGRIVTFAHLINLKEGPLPDVVGSDDAKSARWVPLADLWRYEDKMYEDHIDIIHAMTSKY